VDLHLFRSGQQLLPAHEPDGDAVAELLSALADLARLRSGGQGLFGSGDRLFSYATFGRDSVTTAESLLHLRPDVARDVILTLARLQGTVDAPVGPHSNEEERGKIHHEHRTLYVDGRRIPPASERLLRELADRWGGDETSLTYYGSVDATPLFVRLVARYCATHGESILAETVTRRDGDEITVRDSVLAAVDWVTARMDSSSLGFVEFQRRNPEGLPFQVWKDSNTSYIHLDGALANSDAPIAAVEVQGYAYDALLGAAHLFEARAVEWRDRAQALRERVIRDLWMPGERYFAMGLDREGGGRPRWIESIASNGALLLDTAIFDGLPAAELYVGEVVRRICRPDFVTEAGIRCRSASEGGVVDFQDYHGEWTVWMKETFDVARGLARQGLPRLARQIGIRLLNAVNVAGAHVEFLYVSPDQRVMYDFRARDLRTAEAEVIVGTNRPEAPIAWTVTGALALKWWLGANRELHGAAGAPNGDPWRKALEAEVLEQVSQVALHRTSADLHSAYARRGDFVLDLERGAERDRRARSRGRGSEKQALDR
jgi:glycogen debranching enzyme